MGLAAVEMLALWCLLRFTDFGLRARACMQNAAMASALGMNPNGVYKLTFGLGAALSGLAAPCWRH